MDQTLSFMKHIIYFVQDIPFKGNLRVLVIYSTKLLNYIFNKTSDVLIIIIFITIMLKSLIFTTRYSITNHYPYFLSPDYTPIQYAPQYLQHFAKLKISNPNVYQVDHQRLPKFLIDQVKADKSLFIKQKELFFIGRSNSGKSSLINTIFKNNQKTKLSSHKKLARVAKRPGTTAFLHFHRLHNVNTLIVDSPGYGFAKMNKRRRQNWFGMISEYLKVSSRVAQIFLCINFQHGVKPADIQFLQKIHKLNIDIQLVFTKVDKVPQKKYFAQFQAINETIRRLNLQNVNPRVLACSTKSQFGINQLRCRILEAIQHSKTRNIDGKEDLLLAYLKQLRVSPLQIQKKQKQLTRQHIVRKLIYNSKLTKYLM